MARYTHYLFTSPNWRWLTICLSLLLSSMLISAAIAAWTPIPLPQLDAKTVTLRVAYVHNPRMQGLTQEQIQQLLGEAKVIAKEHFNVAIEFTPIKQVSIKELFEFLPAEADESLSSLIYDFKNNSGDFRRLKRSIVAGLKQEGSTYAKQLEFVRPYLLKPIDGQGFTALADALAATMLGRIEKWKQLLAEDGKPLLDQSNYNEYAYWTNLGYAALPYDVLITNQPIISVEYTSLPIHTTLRGGITAGNTDFNKGSKLGTVVVLSTFAFTAEDDELDLLRNGNSYSETEALKLAGAYLVHELGHMLFHFGHPFGNAACVMAPAELLDFRKWYQSLDADKCKIGSSPAMRIGGAGRQMMYFAE